MEGGTGLSRVLDIVIVVVVCVMIGVKCYSEC